MSYNGDYLVAKNDRNGPLGQVDWVYDTTDTHTTIGLTGYISDAAYTDGTTAKQGKKGLRKGDRIYVRQWSALPTDALVDPYSAAATAPTLIAVSEFIVMGIVQATGVADLVLVDYDNLVNID